MIDKQLKSQEMFSMYGEIYIKTQLDLSDNLNKTDTEMVNYIRYFFEKNVDKLIGLVAAPVVAQKTQELEY